MLEFQEFKNPCFKLLKKSVHKQVSETNKVHNMSTSLFVFFLAMF